MTVPASFRTILEGAVRRNLGLKVLALFIAAALWWFVAGERNVQVGFSVPVEIRNVPAGMAIANKVRDQIDVRIAGPSALLGSLRPKDVAAVIDLSGAAAGPGSYVLSERSIGVPAGFRIQRIDPGVVEIELVKLERRLVPVVPRIGGTSRLKRRIARIIVDPPALEIEALPEELERIASIPTEEIVPDAPEGVFSARVRVELADGHAKIVGNQTVRVKVVFRE